MAGFLRCLFCIALSGLISRDAGAQGCIAIRSFESSCSMGMAHVPDSPSVKAPLHFWELGANARYFKSFRHFRGAAEQEERLKKHNEVINHAYTLDLSVTYTFNSRWSFNGTLPLVYFTRSSLYEHGGKERHTSTAYGIGDIRLGTAWWLVDPQRRPHANLQAALGVKLPSGNDGFEDVFYNVGANNTSEKRPVDQSIQPGDGGWGFYAGLNAFRHFSGPLTAYGNFFYLFNPRNTNGVRTYRETLSATLANESVMSVADQYMGRLGLNYYFLRLPGLSAGLGGRVEGIPVHDLVGSSEGFRRPGYVLSIEPSVNYTYRNNHNFSAGVPVALVRNRLQSVTDKENEAKYHKPVHGDAAFADYLVNISYTYRF